MQNIKNFNFNKLDLFLSNSDYWDFYLNNDKDIQECSPCILTGETLISEFNFNSDFDGLNIDKIYSNRTWVGGVNDGINIGYFGLTGLDNGVLVYDKENIDYRNETLVNILTGTTLNISSGDTRLFLNKVSGSTKNYVYPIEYDNDNGCINFKGGFYQGFYKLDGHNYEVLPNRFNKGFVFDFYLNKNDNLTTGITQTTLNNTYPNNKGIFFYLGTRAENKFWNQYSGNNILPCDSGSTEFCTTLKENEIFIRNDEDKLLPLNPPRIIFTEIDNEFLLYGRRQKNCFEVNDHNKLGTLLAHEVTGLTPTFTITSTTQTIVNKTNPFLIYGRSNGNNCSSRPSDGFGRETVCSYSGSTKDETQIDKNLDIIDNALAFMIKDDGSIGYRLLTMSASCVNNVNQKQIIVKEEFSLSGIIQDNKWEHISIKFSTNNYNECELNKGKQRFGKLMFYVGCKLKFIVNDFPEFIGKRLDEYKEKQIGVPYNISLGGGSQGLIETMTFDGQDPNDLNLEIEKNFAGSFIGSIQSFKIYNTDLNYCQISNLCDPTNSECYLLDEFGDYVLQENNIDKIIVDC
jgi:hypothetical protein